MKYGKIIIDKTELETLKELFSNSQKKSDKTYRLSVEKLMNELKEAKIQNGDLPEDVIRLNSEVTIKTTSNEEKTYQIVTPDKSNLAANKISILAPMGLALLGYAESDSVDWQFPTGISTIKVIKVKN
uniref:GreA/GreB family elongation factor n=1 Tax=Flavobacterium sp. TaxID=239 RepID=UPI00404A8CC7